MIDFTTTYLHRGAREVQYTFNNRVVVIIPQTIIEKYNFQDRSDDAGIVQCVGNAIRLSGCDVEAPEHD